MTLVVRKEFEGVKRYVHLSTGNYNASTAKLYTDLGLFTCNPEICSDVTDIFNYLTGYSKQKEYRKLFVAPVNMREKMIYLIEREIENVKNGSEGKIIWKINSLVDPAIISALYEASNAGVKIELLVRGISCLIPSLEGLSSNIRVRSIVGRFLEHSRVYYFYNNGAEDIYLSSADIMQRNLDRRVEITFPLEDPDLKYDLMKTLIRVSFKDNVKSREQLADGSYRFINSNSSKKINSQEWLMKHSVKTSGELIKS
jgi:polyphosphate kinase